MRRKEQKEFLDENWNKNESEWKAFFGFNKKYFLNEIDLILHKLEDPDNFKINDTYPKVISEKRRYEKLSMSELKEHDPISWKKLSDDVFKRYTDEEGYYYSAVSSFKSKSKLKFRIDHIIPMSKGGLTKLENLQLLTCRENAIKSDKENKELYYNQ